jgi:hypothetical protein
VGEAIAKPTDRWHSGRGFHYVPKHIRINNAAVPFSNTPINLILMRVHENDEHPFNEEHNHDPFERGSQGSRVGWQPGRQPGRTKLSS